MAEIKTINVEHEIMGLQYYIEAMQKHEQRKSTLEDLGNLMIHVNNLKAWAGISDTEQQGNCNLPQVSKCDGVERRNLLIDFCEVYATGNFGGEDSSEKIVDWYLKVKDN